MYADLVFGGKVYDQQFETNDYFPLFVVNNLVSVTAIISNHEQRWSQLQTMSCDAATGLHLNMYNLFLATK